MKALAKDPAARYQTARELMEDLEKCKDTSEKPTAEPKKSVSPSAVRVDPAARAAAAARLTSALVGGPEIAPARERSATARRRRRFSAARLSAIDASADRVSPGGESGGGRSVRYELRRTG